MGVIPKFHTDAKHHRMFLSFRNPRETHSRKRIKKRPLLMLTSQLVKFPAEQSLCRNTQRRQAKSHYLAKQKPR